MDIQKKKTEKLTVGILAHVDAGKTTLSEEILFQTGTTRKKGRVDHKDAFLDNDQMERERGITVFSKEARFRMGSRQVVLLDTPGHADFSSEAERTLQVLDYAILVISGTDGVQGHTLTLWQLLKDYQIPVFLFVNKMDRPETDRKTLLAELRKKLADGVFADFGNRNEEGEKEEIASASEPLMEAFLAGEAFDEDMIAEAVLKRQLFPVSFGSALKGDGVEDFLKTLERYTIGWTAENAEEEPFGGRVYKISRDKKGNRLTHLKVTSGILKNKMVLQNEGEKAEQIRLYNGEKFESVSAVSSGDICAILGPSATYAGQGLGVEEGTVMPLIEPALTYQVELPADIDPANALMKIRQLEEEEPSLHVLWNEAAAEIHVSVMGDLELDILRGLIKRKFDMDVSFGQGSILYKETIAEPVVGIGHYEPLRHYAEVHLLLEPLPRGSGLVFDSLVSEDQFERNWQRLVLSHLAEKPHRGVLTGSEITDMRISLIAGRAHQKHTEGGDFRQATYRAVRQGLRKAQSILLEPVYGFRLEVPSENVGRALSDLERLGARAEFSESTETTAVIRGSGPVATLKDYGREVIGYTRGKGIFSTMPEGYMPCHNAEEVIASVGYLPDQDLENQTGSVFCEHGAAVYVEWDQVDEMAHVSGEEILRMRNGKNGQNENGMVSPEGFSLSDERYHAARKNAEINNAAGEKELEEIFLRTYGKSKREEALYRESHSRGSRRPPAGENFPKLKWSSPADNSKKAGRPLYIIDGYNVIFAWEELKELAAVSIDGARERLIEVLNHYQGYKQVDMLIVFDGYKMAGNPGTRHDYSRLNENAGTLQVVYTKEAETADRFIEKAVYEYGKKRKLWVVTSDRLVQMSALADGASRFSAREFHEEVAGTTEEIRKKLTMQKKEKNQPLRDVF